MKTLIIAQQNELNAVLLYKALAELKSEQDKALMLSIAAEEGRHAAILKESTKESLRPKATLKNIILLSYKTLGKKITFSILSKSEMAASKFYIPFFEKYPKTKQISADEAKHSKLLKQAVNSI